MYYGFFSGFYSFGSGTHLVLVLALVLLLLLVLVGVPGGALQKCLRTQGSVVSSPTEMKFSRIVLQVNTHRLMKSDFWYTCIVTYFQHGADGDHGVICVTICGNVDFLCLGVDCSMCWKWNSASISATRISSRFAACIADIRIPRVPVPAVYCLCRVVGELVRRRVSGDSALGLLHPGQLCQQWWSWWVEDGQWCGHHRHHDVFLLHHRTQHARANLALCQVRHVTVNTYMYERVAASHPGTYRYGGLETHLSLSNFCFASQKSNNKHHICRYHFTICIVA